jgi:tetratricopeptide (TPR) repeat protein
MKEKKEKIYLGLRPFFIKRFLRGVSKSLPFLGSLLDEVIFGVLDEESAQTESKKVHQKLDQILAGQEQQKTDFAEILSAPHGQTDPTLKQGPICNLPYGSIGELFKGRDEDFQQLESQLGETGPSVITQPAALYGLGGIGKTRLAVEFAWRGLKEGVFENVFFVRCGATDGKPEGAGEQKEQAQGRLTAAVNELAGPTVLNIEGYQNEQPEVLLGKVLEALDRRDKRLIIFDNVDGPAMRTAVLGLLPRLAGAKVLVTSRLADWGGAVRSIKIEKLGPEVSAEYLLEKTQGKRAENENDESLARKLAGKLDGLPAALEQAAVYINHLRIGFARYLQELEENSRQVLDWKEKSDHAVDYPATVLATWQMTEQQLGSMEKTLLRLIAFMGPDKIPVWLFEKQGNRGKAAEVLVSGEGKKKPKEVLPAEIRKGLANLADWSMIQMEGESFSIHRLVQETTRLRMEEPERRAFCQIAADLVDEVTAFDPPPYDVRSWGYWREMEGHIASVLVHSGANSIDRPPVRLMNGLGVYYFAQARYAEAEPLMELALEIDEKAYGKDHPKVAGDINNIALMYQDTNRLKEAVPLMKRVVGIMEKAFGQDHPNVATVLNNLALLYQHTNRLKEAEPLMKRALEIDEKAYGKAHPAVARDLNNLATLYYTQGEYAKAEPLYQRALEIDEKTYGKDHPDVARDLNNLALLYQHTNRLKEAEPLMKRALEIDEKAYGKAHPDVARGLNNLATLYYTQGAYAKAELLMKRALEIDEKAYGKDHPEVARDLNNLAALYQDTNRLKEAEPLYQRALEIDENAYGKDHPEVATNLNNLATLYYTQGEYAKAEPLMKRHLEIFLEFRRKTGHPHPHVQAAIRNYAGLLAEMGYKEEEIDGRLKKMFEQMGETPGGNDGAEG